MFTENELTNYNQTVKSSFLSAQILHKHYLILRSWSKHLKAITTLIEAINSHKTMCEQADYKLNEVAKLIINNMYKRVLI